MSDELSNERKIQVFSSWLELETDFLQTRCVVVTATNAIVEVSKCYQKENEHICVYTSKFEEYWRFFKATLTEEAMITIFLNNVHKSYRFMRFG